MRFALGLGSLLMLAACAAPPKPVAGPVPVRLPPPPQPTVADWRDLPLTPGNWIYQPAGTGSSAGYVGGSDTGPVFTISCDTRSRSITFSRAGAGNGIKIRTTFGDAYWPAEIVDPGNPRMPGNPRTVVRLIASDPFLDKLAYSRGRFAVETEGSPRLVLPARPEVARVIEDCRG